MGVRPLAWAHAHHTGNSASQDLRTLAALGIAAVVLVPMAVAAFRAAR
jgi:hypothetical protein